MEAVGTVGRYRGRQAFMNTDFKIYDGNISGNSIYNGVFYFCCWVFLLLSVTSVTSGEMLPCNS